MFDDLSGNDDVKVFVMIQKRQIEVLSDPFDFGNEVWRCGQDVGGGDPLESLEREKASSELPDASTVVKEFSTEVTVGNNVLNGVVDKVGANAAAELRGCPAV